MSELKEYLKILCDSDYPKFIDKYLETKELQRLKGIDQFCGCFYTNLHNVKYWYSRYDHSLATALMTYHFAKDKIQTLSALFHDLGTPCFSHCVDFMLGDSVNQESSERNVLDILRNSEDICTCLKQDGILIDWLNTSKYGVVENKFPRLCVDRLDGILTTGLIWTDYLDISDIEKIYKNMTVLRNEDNNYEIGFKNIDSALVFFDAMLNYSYVLQRNEDKYTLSFIADILKKMCLSGYVKVEDLYNLSEEDVIKLIVKHDGKRWNQFITSKKLMRSIYPIDDCFVVSIESKNRHVIPLVRYQNNIVRLDEISLIVKQLLEEFKNYKDTEYCYIKRIKKSI